MKANMNPLCFKNSDIMACIKELWNISTDIFDGKNEKLSLAICSLSLHIQRDTLFCTKNKHGPERSLKHTALQSLMMTLPIKTAASSIHSHILQAEPLGLSWGHYHVHVIHILCITTKIYIDAIDNSSTHTWRISIVFREAFKNMSQRKNIILKTHTEIKVRVYTFKTKYIFLNFLTFEQTNLYFYTTYLC